MAVMYCKRRNISLSNSFLNLHDDILVMIFTRLSVGTILKCKIVCKSLYTFLSSRYFAESYRSNPPFTSLMIIHTGEFFSLLELNSGYDYSLKSNKPKILPDAFGLSYCGLGTRFLVGSCNGFFCYSDKDVLYVSNPLSGTHVRLPEEVFDASKRFYGFGFCPQTQQYKVIELATYVRPFSRTEVRVFTVGVDKFWRRVHSPFQHIQQRLDKTYLPYPIIQFFEVNGKGALHWIVDDSNRLDYLYSFDIIEENVRPIPPPVGLKKRNLSTRLVFMHGCLCLLHMNEDEEEMVEFWCMTEYMVQGSWTLRIISRTSFPKYLTLPRFHVVAFWKNEEILMLSQCNYIVSCNIEQKNFNKLDIDLPSSSMYDSAACFVPNFFSCLQETGTTEAETKDAAAAARKLGLLSQKKSEPTELGNGRARIMENILSRVPVDTIRSAKTYSMLNNTVHLILCDKASLRFVFEVKSDLNNCVKASQLLATTPSTAKVTVLGSCNGLVCLSVFNDLPDQTHSICICNPLLQELAILPQPQGVKRIRDEAYGFGFSSMTGHYKVLRILTRKWRPGKFEAYVLTIGIDKNWRREVDGCTFRMPKKWPENINKARFCDVSFNNAIHWIGEGDSTFIIYAFDIDEEQFTSLAHLPGIYNTKYRYPCLGILRDRLCVCVIYSQTPYVVELWSMTTYGSVASWTRETINISNRLPWLRRKAVLPVTSWRDEEILMWIEDGGGSLISYCSKEKRYTEIKIDIAANNEALMIPIPYVQSFLSLKDAVQNGNLEVNKKMMNETAFCKID